MAEVLRAVQGDRLVFDIKLTQHNERYELGYDEKVYFNVFTRSYEPDFTSETVLYIEQESTTIKIDKIELDPGEYSFDAGIVFPDGTTKTVLPCIPNQKNTLYVYDKSCSNRDNIMGTIWDEAFDAKVKNPICSCYEIERIYKLIAQMDSNSFMTVQTRAELDNIPSDRIANGKLVRVEDNGNGHSEYFSYDTDTNRWLPEAFVQDGNPLIATFGTYSTDLSDDAYRYGVASGTEDKEEGVVEYIPNDYGYNHDIPADNSIYVNTTNGNIYKVHRETVINDYNTVIGYNVSYELVYNDNIPIRIITSMCARSLDYGIYKSLGINYLKLSTTSDSKINKDFYDKFTLYDIDEDAVNIFNRMLNISIMNTAPRDSLIDICSNRVSNLLIEYISSSETSYIKSQRISRILSLALIGYVPKSTRISNIPLYGDISRNDLLDSLGILYSLDCLPPDHVGGENDEAKYNDILNYGTMFFRQPGGKSDEYLSDKNSLYIVNQVSSHWGQGGLFLGSDIGYCKFISNSVPFYYSDENDPPESNNVLVYGKAINSTLNGNKYVYFIDTDRIGAQFYTIKDNEDRLFMLKSFSDTIDSNNFTTRSYEWERIALYKDTIHVGDNLLSTNILIRRKAEGDSYYKSINIDPVSYPASIKINDEEYDGTSEYSAGKAIIKSETGSMAAAKRHTISIDSKSDVISISSKYLTSTLNNVIKIYNNRLERYYAKSLYNYQESGYQTDTFNFPRKSGTFALLDDIPSLSLYDMCSNNTNNNIEVRNVVNFQTIGDYGAVLSASQSDGLFIRQKPNSSNNSCILRFDGYNPVSSTRITPRLTMSEYVSTGSGRVRDISIYTEGIDRFIIDSNQNPSNIEYNILFPNKSGTFALLDDIPTIPEIPDNINKESGYVYDTALFSVEEGISDVVINGTYVLEGDYCKIDAEAKLVDGWAVVYYSLPVVAIATGCTIEHHVDGNQYSIRTMHQNGNIMNVLGIRRLDNSNLDSNPSTIHFHLEYKYR